MVTDSYLEPETTKHVIGAFFEVYNTLGFGFLERIYADALEYELLGRGRKVQREVLRANVDNLGRHAAALWPGTTVLPQSPLGQAPETPDSR